MFSQQLIDNLGTVHRISQTVVLKSTYEFFVRAGLRCLEVDLEHSYTGGFTNLFVCTLEGTGQAIARGWNSVCVLIDEPEDLLIWCT